MSNNNSFLKNICRRNQKIERRLSIYKRKRNAPQRLKQEYTKNENT